MKRLNAVASNYGHGLQSSIRNNSAAFGYSAMITAGFSAVSQSRGRPDAFEGLLFVLGAVAAFTVLDAAATRGFRRPIASEPPQVITLGSSFSFLSVGLGFGAAFAIGLIPWIGAWPLGSFAATSVYVTVLAMELSAAQTAHVRQSQDQEGGE